jgi:ABC-type phosphate/phosphonate transport system substrate-binding protein
MKGQQGRGLRFLALAGAVLTLLVGGLSAGEQGRRDKLRIGVLDNMFLGMPKAMAIAASQPFRSLLESQTGMQGEVTAVGDAGYLGQQLHDGKIDLAVLHGVEFAWARGKYPELRPLMICVNGSPHLRAHVLVLKDNPAAELMDLKGKSVAVPRTNREHCRLYLERSCRLHGLAPQELFGQTPTPPNAEDALDDVVDGQVQGIVLDNVAIECYKRRKPVRFDRLKEIAHSETFPAGVIAYREGAFDKATLRRLQDGLLGANRTAYGRQLMTLWRMTAFERVPDDYEQTLTDIVKVYPPPRELSK